MHLNMRLLARLVRSNIDDICLQPFALEVKYIKTLKQLKLIRPTPLLKNFDLLPGFGFVVQPLIILGAET